MAHITEGLPAAPDPLVPAGLGCMPPLPPLVLVLVVGPDDAPEPLESAIAWAVAPLAPAVGARAPDAPAETPAEGGSVPRAGPALSRVLGSDAVLGVPVLQPKHSTTQTGATHRVNAIVVTFTRMK
ncbi:MAG: hypothetical protein ABW321_22340 [Polyangiales bacterium]